MFLHPEDLLYSRLREATNYFGYNRRKCFIASSDPGNLVQLKENILEKVHDMFISDFSQGEGALLHRTLSHHALSISRFCHSVFQLSPNDDDECRFRDGEIAAVSPWALDVLLSAYEAEKADVSLKLYDLLVEEPETRVLRGQIFERQMVKYFASLKEPVQFDIRSLDDSAISEWTFSGLDPTKNSFFQSLTGGSILYIPGEVRAVMQITTWAEHPVAVVALERIQAQLKPFADLGSSIWAKRWQFIFVVPDDMTATFTKQPFEGTDDQEWSKKVDQYVLGMKEVIYRIRRLQRLF